jgi:PKD repeat protein
MKKISLYLGLAVFAITGNIVAQETNYCHTDEMVRRALSKNPTLVSDYLAEQARLEAEDLVAAQTGYSSQNRAQLPIYTIPVVFHVLHQNGTENISDAQINDQIRILNEDYRKQNADISAVVSSFTSVAADAEIEFRLAKKDPSGNCTNGIDRIFTPLTNAADDNSKLNPWPRNKYLNIWVVKSIGTSGVAGYAYLPGTAPSAGEDGILILSTYIGSIGSGSVNTSRALTHEIGHFLNLQHTWGNTNNPGVACGNDNVTDTPVTKGHTSCQLSDATCTSGVIENVQNFMEYSYCSKMFTTGQKTRMRNALGSALGQRSSLWTSTNLTATGVSTPAVLCTADFQSNNPTNTVCAGNSLTFTDISWNGNPTSWSWTFPGGTPSTSTDSVPVVLYNTPGIYSVSLTVSDASGSVSTTKPGYVTVNSNVATYSTAFYSESFEGAAIPNTEYIVRNQSPGGNTWVQTSTAAATGTKSIMISNLSNSATYVDELIGPSIDMTAISGSSPVLTFKTAYAQRTSTDADKLQFYVSTNCGNTWILRKSLTGATLTSGGVVTGTFTPNSTQWLTQTVNLAGYVTQPNLYFMFRFTSDGGNNIFIDDINIYGTSATGVEDLASSTEFNIYPNPIDQSTVIAFNLNKRENIDVSVIDVLGREVTKVFNGELNEGDHQFALAEQSKLTSGMYFVRVIVDGKSFTKKMMVK